MSMTTEFHSTVNEIQLKNLRQEAWIGEGIALIGAFLGPYGFIILAAAALFSGDRIHKASLKYNEIQESNL